MQNLRHRLLTIREYTEEVYKVNLRVVYVEESIEKVVRYVNGLRMKIHEELSTIAPRTVEEAY